jgi:tubulin-specific chaperone A
VLDLSIGNSYCNPKTLLRIMPPPSQLHIATQSVSRLLKEETSYHKELGQQQGRVTKLEDEIKAGGSGEDGNAEFMLKQEVGFPF